MRYLMLYRPADTTQFEAGAPPAPEMIARMGHLIQRKFAEGKLLSTEGCGPTSHGALVTYNKGSSASPTAPSPRPRRSSAASPSSV